MNVFCKFLALSLTPAICLIVSGAAARADGLLIGKYCGQLLNGTHLVPSETDLFSDGKGGLTGKYQFDDGGQIYDGKFLNSKMIGSGEWLLQWQDAFGIGTLDIRFSAGTSQFTGNWGSDKSKPSHEWNGKLCDAQTSS